MGDSNFNLLDLSNHNVDFLNFIMSNDLYPHVSVPTRITGQNTTLIDNIFINSANLELCYVNDDFYALSVSQTKEKENNDKVNEKKESSKVCGGS